MPPFRIEPLMPAHAYRTYSMTMPLGTHFRPATCDEIGCGAYINGWQTIVPAASGHAQLIRSADFRRRYRYTEQPGEGPLVIFSFPPGQQCFKASTHKLPLGRPATFSVRDGDWRGNPRGTPPRVHARAEFWVEEMQENLDQLNDALERG